MNPLQMLAVLIPSVVMEIFATYFTIKIIIFKAPIRFLTIIDFVLWIVSLVVSKFLVTYVSASCAGEAKKLNVLVENCSNFCNDEITFEKVQAWLRVKFYQIVLLFS